MTEAFVDFGAGFLAGGLAVSTAWGLFWLAIGLIGWNRRTCRGGIVIKGIAGGFVPLSLLLGLLWWRGGSGYDGVWFASGLVGMPALLSILSLRRMPDGKTAGTHFFEGVRFLMSDLLGAHRGCGGCDHAQDHKTCQ
ncbi:MAG: hypothetical protein Nkreftii_002913 [Candidatus Nitrospira kreftii]|uniref:Uncharacterized protein n=1 Tax=Candidatus Nitrospira kreftii TaxID=2652173 RepID=A0A7S8FG21_9BACT|nr:MAG: hypothetical protein Nkreftii_002913 [Candidatus Nitrospira kreftii]